VIHIASKNISIDNNRVRIDDREKNAGTPRIREAVEALSINPVARGKNSVLSSSPNPSFNVLPGGLVEIRND